MSKRWICMLIRHRYKAERLPDSGDDGGVMLRSERCAHIKKDDGSPSHWAGGLGGMSG